LPKWLDRILPDVDVEGAKLERTHPVPREAESVEPAVGQVASAGTATAHPAHRG
jgi:RND superfamily putative drug exporter